MSAPRCPRCGRPSATPHGNRDYYCHTCRQAFDPTDDGDIGYQQPDRIAERREEHARRKAGRMKLSTDFSRFDEKKLKGGLGK